jgi:hypothetical protein
MIVALFSGTCLWRLQPNRTVDTCPVEGSRDHFFTSSTLAGLSVPATPWKIPQPQTPQLPGTCWAPSLALSLTTIRSLKVKIVNTHLDCLVDGLACPPGQPSGAIELKSWPDHGIHTGLMTQCSQINPDTAASLIKTAPFLQTRLSLLFRTISLTFDISIPYIKACFAIYTPPFFTCFINL